MNNLREIFKPQIDRFPEDINTGLLWFYYDSNGKKNMMRTAYFKDTDSFLENDKLIPIIEIAEYQGYKNYDVTLFIPGYGEVVVPSKSGKDADFPGWPHFIVH